MRKCIERYLWELAPMWPGLGSLLRDKVRIMVMPSVTLRRYATNVLRWTDTFNLEVFVNLTAERLHHTAAGHDLIRIPLNGRWPMTLRWDQQLQ